jgi:penicillin-binding protein 1C
MASTYHFGRFWKKYKRLIGVFLTPILFFIIADFVFPFRVNPRYSTLVAAADGSTLHTFLNPDDKWRLYTTLPEITPLLRQTFLFKEDKYFYYHTGFNPVSMARALLRNIATGRRTSGASTITMQVVRLLQPRKRTYTSKTIELFRALQLEWHYSKDEILQLYLNLIPYGSNIEGIKSASLLYFGKPPQLLSLAEITTLTIIPNRPSSLRLGLNNALVVQERNRWLRRFKKNQLFENQIIEDAANEPLRAFRRSAPVLAPHLAIRLKQTFGDRPIINTTLQPKTQQAVEQLVQNYANRLHGLNIQNAAVVVVNNKTMAVEAYVGSADFYNATDGGQVDGVRAVRSPGSTLKPFIYGLAFDKGFITPKTMLNDVPTNFKGFEPENFDRKFNGKITVEFALANSLNIPAVQVLQLLTPAVLIEKLKQADFKTIQKQSGQLGLSMALGGCGVTLEELTKLFAALANDGKLQNLRLVAEQSSKNGLEILSPEATFLITNTLTKIARPDLPNNFDNTYRLPRIAWKTGTSYGKKDAWSIGYNRQYTVGVWVGNFSGQGVPELSGADIATPLLFNIFNTVAYNSPTGWFKPAPNLTVRKVCAESGQVPSEFCTHAVADYAIMGVSATLRCQHLKPVFVNTSKTVSYCTQCLPDSGYVRQLYPNLAPELIAYFEAGRVPYQKIPMHNPACTRVLQTGAPVIVSLNDGSEYYLNPDDPQPMQLACQAQNDVREVYWYINDKLFQKASPQQPIFSKLPFGKVKISCSDDQGRNTDIWINVR